MRPDDEKLKLSAIIASYCLFGALILIAASFVANEARYDEREPTRTEHAQSHPHSVRMD